MSTEENNPPTNPYESSSPQNSENSTSNFTILMDLFTSPSKAAVAIQENYAILFPFGITVLLTAAAMVTYYSIVDFPWLIDYMAESAAGDLSKSEQDAVRAGMEFMSPTLMGTMGAVGAVIGLAFVYLIQAVYLVIVSNISNDGFDFKQWFSFAAWSSTPSLVAVLAMFAVFLSSSNLQIPPESLNPLNLNDLIFGLDGTKGIGQMLSSMHLAQIWVFAVMGIVYQKWTNKSLLKSYIIVLAPYFLIYAVWGWFVA